MIKLIKEVPLWNAGYVKQYDFSQANTSEEARIEHVCAVARVCRGDKTQVKTDEELYQQLLTEHDGKPGSVFEFVPVTRMIHVKLKDEYKNLIKYGNTTDDSEFFDKTNSNLRALIADGWYDSYNNNSDGFFVFKIKVPQMIVKHILRHRMLCFQEMSERTNKLREYYYCDEFEPILNEVVVQKQEWNNMCYTSSQSDFDYWQKQYKIRQELLNKGSHGLAYTTLWIAGWKQDPNGWDNFFAVRTKKPAQREIIDLANVLKEMMGEQ